MKSFDLPLFIFAVLGTIGIMGIGISFAQTSMLMFLGFLILSLGAVGAGFSRKKMLRSNLNDKGQA
ncbi:hypothetical protein CR203_02175 [Salipaludibacillus neizhouensis]|uniref:Uncharacterized protein n=1 Tax=Salipaludibacillus neizhouensis TaxID=885475 RepID=A0A3A9K9K0_9BACI|nr:DUF5325 family protein [Salipaludibacillus neizhouensis]RKL68869.1 hypothetical protein CR203_02175 [Salipaludibacillus neizhouensis]